MTAAGTTRKNVAVELSTRSCHLYWRMAVYTPMLTPKRMESTVASVTSCSEAEIREAMAGATGDWSGLRPQFHWVRMPLSQRK